MELSKGNIDELKITIPKKVGQNIRREREKQGLSQTELSILIQSDRQYLYKIESGKVGLSIVKLVIISKSLNIPVSNLLEDI
jgi:transcriptional regulator with XRE-family HTH domain